MPTPFADRLAEAVRTKQSALVVGLDPQLEKLPLELRRAADAGASDARERAAAALRAFDAAVIELVAPFAVAVKPQSAFYERWGAPGVAAYEHAAETARAAGLLVIGDIKRGDIGTTAAAYAEGHLVAPEHPAARADAVTLNPLLGTDSIAPFLAAMSATGGGCFVLVRTSNPSATELQDLRVDGRALHEHVAELVARWGQRHVGACGYSSVGAVVGATAPDELRRLRARLPQAWFLVPGVGAQGATADDVAAAFDADGLGAVVNSSRGILYAYGEPAAPAWKDAVRGAARTLRDQLRRAAQSALR
jgi:orotidine-5'-phosphate decarboxylase